MTLSKAKLLYLGALLLAAPMVTACSASDASDSEPVIEEADLTPQTIRRTFAEAIHPIGGVNPSSAKRVKVRDLPAAPRTALTAASRDLRAQPPPENDDVRIRTWGYFEVRRGQTLLGYALWAGRSAGDADNGFIEGFVVGVDRDGRSVFDATEREDF